MPVANPSYIGLYILIFIGCVALVLVVRRMRRRSRDREDIDADVSEGITSVYSYLQHNGRLFTLAELKQAEIGKYNWDESGYVFEINSDGTATVVGHFDVAELTIDPNRELYDRIVDEGLFDMLPRMWSFMTQSPVDETSYKFILVSGSLKITTSLNKASASISNVNEASFYEEDENMSQDDIPSAINLMLHSRSGVVILMPANEKEFIFSLGAQACINRLFVGNVEVKISSPAVMGALWRAINASRVGLAKFSFAWGEDNDYMCCNMIAENGLCEVRELLPSSIIRPSDSIVETKCIAKTCFIQSLSDKSFVRPPLLRDMIPYTVSLILNQNNHVIKIVDLINQPTSIPIRSLEKKIAVGSNHTLSLLIGSTIVIDDVISEYDIPSGNIEAVVEVDASMKITLSLTSDDNIYKINIGELIG